MYIFFSIGIPGTVLHQQQTIGLVGIGEVQEGQIPRMFVTVPHRESLLQSQQVWKCKFSNRKIGFS